MKRDAFILLVMVLEMALTIAFEEQIDAEYAKNSFENRSQNRLYKTQFYSRFLKNKREIWVHIPVGYASEEPYPLLIVFDGQAYITDELIPGPKIIDALIANHAIPPVVTVFVSSLDQDSRNRELPCYSPFADFITKELLPWVQKTYRVAADPKQTIVAGSSYGGLAATYLAFCHPELFGKVLSQSGAFWWKNSWMVSQLRNAPHLPIELYLDVGNQETGNMLAINRQMRSLLQQKGYLVHYYEFNGGHDYDCWKETFARGLVELLGSRR